MKKILILTLSPVTGTSSRIIKEAQTLSTEFEVLVVSLNTGEQLTNENIQGINVYRISIKSKKLPKTVFFQIFKFIEFGKIIIKNFYGYDIIDCHCLITLMIGYIIKKKFGSQLVLNAHELETKRNRLKMIFKLAYSIIEKKLIYKCNAVIVVSETIKEWYCNKYHIKNIFCIFNSPRYKEFDKSDYFRKKYALRTSDIIFLFQGMFLKGNGLELLLQTFNLMRNTNYYLVFMGKGLLEETIKQASLSNDHIFLHEMVPQNELYKYTSSADFGFSIAEKTSLSYEYSMPNKLFEYIMYEIPVIVANTKEQAQFVKKYEIGYCLNDYRPECLIKLINSIDYSEYDTMIKKIKEVKKEISWDKQENKLLDIYRGL